MDEEYGPATRPAKRRPAGSDPPGASEPEQATREDGFATDRNRAKNGGRGIDPAAFRSALLGHFDRHRRPLPWRTDRNPYRVTVSEFMLQQTRVETVGPYYARWLERFPDWRTLAAAPLDAALLEWKGLGYYSRARNLHRTARAVRERYGGELPADPVALKTLPGVGEYTAGAVASIAFGRQVPAVDGNVRRVLARLLDLARPTPAQVRREAARLLDPDRPGDHNEAMMELGATICTPRAPRCGECPVAAWCAALAAGTVAERPATRPRRPVPRVDYATVVAIDAAGRILLAKRPEEGLLAGMWEFPSGEVRESDPDTVARSALQHLSIFGASGRRTELLATVRQTFTHLRATYHPVVIRFDRGGSPTPEGEAAGQPEPLAAVPEHAWIRPAEIAGYALPVAQQKIARLVEAWMRKAGDQ